MANLHMQLTAAPEYLDALAQLNANFAAVADLLAANQQLLAQFLQRPPQLVKLPSDEVPQLDLNLIAEKINAISDNRKRQRQ